MSALPEPVKLLKLMIPISLVTNSHFAVGASLSTQARKTIRFDYWLRLLALCLFALSGAISYGQYGVVIDRHDFGTGTDGTSPQSTPVLNPDHQLYGTCNSVGVNGSGILWKYVPTTNAYTDVHDFGGAITTSIGVTGTDGKNPSGDVAIDDLGNVFGVTTNGGQHNLGMVWEFSSSGVYKDLYDFQAGSTSGELPTAGVAIDAFGELWGVTPAGGAHLKGMLWIIPDITNGNASFKDQHDFGANSSDGVTPMGGIAFDSDGNLYGTTSSGQNATGAGSTGTAGVIWEYTSGGDYKVLHSFGLGFDGAVPVGSVTVDSAGDVYGTTEYGGKYGGSNGAYGDVGGTVWEYSSSGTYTDLYDFGGEETFEDGSSGFDGSLPVGTITIDSIGNLYGTTKVGGEENDGIVWELAAGGAYIDLIQFGAIGKNPYGGVAITSVTGTLTLYGTTSGGGSNNDGILWVNRNPPLLGSVTLNPATIIGGYSTTGTVNLLSVSTKDTPVALTSQWPGYVSVPASVVVPAGQTSATFTASVSQLYSATFTNIITASIINATQTATLTVTGESLSSLSVSPSSIGGFGTSTGTVTIANPAPPGGWTVNLTSGLPGYISVPSTVVVPAGATTATFSLTALGPHTSTVTCAINATDVATGVSTTVTIQGDSISSLSLNPSSMGWNSSTTGTVTLSSPAPAGGWTVGLHPGISGYVSMPATLAIPAGSSSASFTISGTGQHGANMGIGIYASDGATAASAILNISGDSISNFTLSPSTIGWGGLSIATVTLGSPAPTGGWTANVQIGAPGYFDIPSTITVPAGQSSAKFAVFAVSQYSFSMNTSITVSDGSSQKSAILTVVGDSLANISLSPSAVAPGSGTTGTVTLTSPAPTGGWTVNLSVGAPSLVGVPASVIVPAGSTTATFPVTTYVGEPATSVSVIANDGGSQVQTILTVT